MQKQVLCCLFLIFFLLFVFVPQTGEGHDLEQLVVDHKLCFKDLEEALGVTKYQWDHAQVGIKAICSGHKKKKAEHGGK